MLVVGTGVFLWLLGTLVVSRTLFVEVRVVLAGAGVWLAFFGYLLLRRAAR